MRVGVSVVEKEIVEANLIGKIQENPGAVAIPIRNAPKSSPYSEWIRGRRKGDFGLRGAYL